MAAVSHAKLQTPPRHIANITAIILAAITSLLPTLVGRFALPIQSLLDCQATQARLATSIHPQPRVDLVDVTATPANLVL
jgi:hypothetical protein